MSTTTEKNKAIIRRFFDAWNGRQPDAFDDLIAPDVVRHCEATPGVEARSLDQIKQFLRQGCWRKIEMSPGAQSRDDTAVGGGHDERDLECILAVRLSSAFDCFAGSGLSYYCR